MSVLQGRFRMDYLRKATLYNTVSGSDPAFSVVCWQNPKDNISSLPCSYLAIAVPFSFPYLSTGFLLIQILHFITLELMPFISDTSHLLSSSNSKATQLSASFHSRNMYIRQCIFPLLQLLLYNPRAASHV